MTVDSELRHRGVSFSQLEAQKQPRGYLNAFFSMGRAHAHRRRMWLPWLSLSIVGLFTYYYYHIHYGTTWSGAPAYPITPSNPQPQEGWLPPTLPPPPSVTLNSHPIKDLVENATAEFNAVLKRQSKTLEEAVKEYRRRHGIPPPPNFDKWFSFAQKKGVVLIDEFDSILDSLRPFWGLSPATIRARARESLGYNNVLLTVLIRDGHAKGYNGPDWQRDSTVGMMSGFVQWLPDMDLAFNTNDESRVLLSHADLSTLVKTANDKMKSVAAHAGSANNVWSKPPADLNYKIVPETSRTRFNVFSHQPIWTHARMSCPPDSPAGSPLGDAKDDMAAYSYSDIMLIQNHTAYSDICLSPSLESSFGFFERPNAFNVIQELYPIFSQSKISSFQDIVYPSPWYWNGNVKYKTSQDMRWEDKKSVMFWRGSSTGGFARDGGWRRQHRQQVVRNVYAKDKVRVFSHPTVANGADTPASNKWALTQTQRDDYVDMFDVGFSHWFQCDPEDCREQEDYFGIKSRTSQREAWNYKYLLDMDGNAYSGRFYAFLQSFSIALKMAIFREWHDGDGWIRPWVHYIPLSFAGHDLTEVMRYVDKEEEGQKLAQEMAQTSRAWAQKALRNDDLEVWFFRLLLEYGRLVDDDRDHIGYAGPASAPGSAS